MELADPVLHEEKAYPEQWWACQEPERPFDYLVLYDERCPKCILKAQADLVRTGDTCLVRYSRGGTTTLRRLANGELA